MPACKSEQRTGANAGVSIVPSLDTPKVHAAIAAESSVATIDTGWAQLKGLTSDSYNKVQLDSAIRNTALNGFKATVVGGSGAVLYSGLKRSPAIRMTHDGDGWSPTNLMPVTGRSHAMITGGVGNQSVLAEPSRLFFPPGKTCRDGFVD